MDDKMTIGDALNIANVASDCLADHGDQDVRELAIAAKRLVRHIAEQSREIGTGTSTRKFTGTGRRAACRRQSA